MTNKDVLLSNLHLIKSYIEIHKQHLLDLVDGVPYSNEFGKKVVRRHCEHLDFDLRQLSTLENIISKMDD